MRWSEKHRATGREVFFQELRKKFKRPAPPAIEERVESKPEPKARQMGLAEYIQAKRAPSLPQL
jgi:hypothetical protein